MKNLRIVIAGGSGFIGQALAARWSGDNSVVILSRRRTLTGQLGLPPLEVPGVHQVYWDGKEQGTWSAAVDGCDLLLNLAGKSVNCRYTAEAKAEIFSSRLDSTRALGEAAKAAARQPALWINASSATIYPNAKDQPYDEWSPERESDFSVQVVQAWEAAFNAIELPQTRKALLRTAIVLGQGGALQPYARLARWRLGGRQGSGKQMFSWLHIEDFARIIEWLWEHPEQEGVYNASAPAPVRNEQLMAILRRFYHVRIGIPAPAGLLKVAALFMGTETELLLKSRWVLPARLLKEGFLFRHPELPETLVDLLRPRGELLPVSHRLLRFKKTDLLVQELLVLLGILTLPFGGVVLLLFGLGGWQLVSAAVHYSKRSELPLSQARRRYGKIVIGLFAGLAAFFGIALLLRSDAVATALEITLLSMLVVGPVLAIWYYTICRREILNVHIASQAVVA